MNEKAWNDSKKYEQHLFPIRPKGTIIIDITFHFISKLNTDIIYPLGLFVESLWIKESQQEKIALPGKGFRRERLMSEK